MLANIRVLTAPDGSMRKDKTKVVVKAHFDMRS